MQNITDSWFVQGMIKATSDAWLKGWDERNGGNLTLRLDEADIAPFAANFHEKPRYIALSQPMPLLANTPFIVTGSGKFFRNVQLDPAANLGVVKKCLVVFPDGVGILPWMVPGTDEIGQATAQEMQKHSLVLWPFHGVFGSGPTLDETFGLIDTAEKSAEVLVKIYSMGGMKQTITREELVALGKRFGVTPLASAVALY
ncbi:rhamnulose-1-phosphate aldolase [Salmonella enterica]|nr:rhamnulose-1-phosphate aldolase [Salmonella enterica]ELB8524286.1 rhamnulose-1-phosphate aldolase [Salmonella enterica]